MRVNLLLTPSDWPKEDYPEPIPGDLYTPHYPARDDLLEYAFSTGNQNHANVIVALDALHTFREAPSIEDVLSIHEQFMATGTLACLGDISAEIQAVTQLRQNRLTFEPTLQALNVIVNTLQEILSNQTSYWREDQALSFREQILHFIQYPTIAGINRMNTQLFAPNGALSRLQGEIPENELVQLYEAFEGAREPLSESFFATLENKIVNFIAEEILPGFIASVREKSAAEQ